MKRKLCTSILLGLFSLLAVHGEPVFLLDESTRYDYHKKSASPSSGISVSTMPDYIVLQFSKPVGEVGIYLMSDNGDIIYSQDLSVASPISISIPYHPEGEYTLLIIECKEKGTTLQLPLFNQEAN